MTMEGARVTIPIQPGVELDETLEMNVQTVRPLEHDASGKLVPTDPSPKVPALIFLSDTQKHSAI